MQQIPFDQIPTDSTFFEWNGCTVLVEEPGVLFITHINSYSTITLHEGQVLLIDEKGDLSATIYPLCNTNPHPVPAC